MSSEDVIIIPMVIIIGSIIIAMAMFGRYLDTFNKDIPSVNWMEKSLNLLFSGEGMALATAAILYFSWFH